MWEKFIDPYERLYVGAYYSLMQILDGLGLAPHAVINMTTEGELEVSRPITAAILDPSLVLSILAVGAFCLAMLSGYVLGRSKGAAVSLLVFMLPGLLSLFNLIGSYSLVPDVYHIGGTGVLGSPLGFLPISLCGVMLGWACVVIFYDTFRLTDRFRHYYDHAWFLAAILAGVFFVADSASNQDAKNLEDTTTTVRNASLYFLAQAKAYDSDCQARGRIEFLSCKWAADVQQRLSDYAEHYPGYYKEFGPRSSGDIYALVSRRLSPDEIVQVRREVSAYNDERCPVRQLAPGVMQNTVGLSICQMVPADFCIQFPDPPKGLVDEYVSSRTVAFASECIVPTMVVLRKIQEKQMVKVSGNKEAKNYRWIFFLLFSLVVGGKIANSTTRLANIDGRPDGDRQRLLSLVSRVYSGMLLLMSLSVSAYRYIRSRG